MKTATHWASTLALYGFRVKENIYRDKPKTIQKLKPTISSVLGSAKKQQQLKCVTENFEERHR